MKKYIALCLLLFLVKTGFSQELNCQVTVDAQQTGKTQLSIFKTLERAIQDFVTENSWTSLKLDNNEKISCSIFITVKQYDSDNFKASIQVQSSRPVYGSTMVTPVLNYKDNDFDFSYTEYQPLDYNPNSFSSNLVSGISFYVYTILGMDADTFSPLGGTKYYEEAQRIVNTAQQSNYIGWKATDGNQTRFRLNQALLSNNFTKLREAIYTYHREGLDIMHDDVKAGKEKIAESIAMLRAVNNTRPNSFLMRVFFDSKADEIEQIFSGGPSVSIKEVVDDLNSIAPLYNKKWRNINY